MVEAKGYHANSAELLLHPRRVEMAANHQRFIVQSTIPSGKQTAAGVRLTDSTFQDVCLGNARFDDVNFGGAIFHDVNLAQARFDDVNLTGVEITNANLAGMKINGVLVAELLARFQGAGDGKTE
jgi:uncharacterized protein YjbI with pentapeptide repeats